MINIDLFIIYLIQYQLAVDKFAHRPRQAPQFELQDFFGQVLRFIVVNIPLSLDYGIEAQSFVYAVIDEIKLLDQRSRTNLFYQATGPIVLIDLNQVQCVIGRILDRGKWAIALCDPWGLFFIHLTHESGISYNKGMNSGWMNLG